MERRYRRRPARFRLAGIACAAVLACGGCAEAGAQRRAFNPAAFWREPPGLPFDVTVLKKGDAGGASWQSMLYTSEVYRGRPMRIFAYYARPPGGGRHPGVVDIHGGGGAASLPRAMAFAQAGFACLSFDWNTFGDSPAGGRLAQPPTEPGTVFAGLRYGDWSGQFVTLGPDGKRPVIYRAVMAARRGLTWLARRPEVDAGRLAIEGHSWGGFLAQLVAGIDPRVKAAVSSAAAGAWAARYHQGLEGHLRLLEPWQAFQWLRRYDPAAYAEGITAPILVRLAAADFFGSIDTLADYWPAIAAPKALELLPGDSHTFADVETRAAWFDHWLRDGPAFPVIRDVSLERGSGGWTVRVRAGGPAAIAKATVCWTTSPRAWKDRVWVCRYLRQDGGAWTGTFRPVEAGGPLRAFVSVRDANRRVVSSLPLIRPAPKTRAQPPIVVSGADVEVVRTDVSPISSPEAWRRSRPVGPIAMGPEAVGEQSARLEALWDAEAMYLRVDADDRTPWTPRPAGAAWTSGDSVQVRLAADAGAERAQRVLHVGWHPEAGAAAPGVHAARGPDGKEEIKRVGGLRAAVDVRKGGGYVLAARIPWSLLDPGFTAAPGGRLRLALLVTCGDLLTAERAGVIDFNHASKGPEHWGTATLLAEQRPEALSLPTRAVPPSQEFRQ